MVYEYELENKMMKYLLIGESKGQHAGQTTLGDIGNQAPQQGGNPTIRKIGEALDLNTLCSAAIKFGKLGDKEKLLEIIRVGEAINDSGAVDIAVRYFFGKKVIKTAKTGFEKWASEKGFQSQDLYFLPLPQAANMAYHLWEDYDIGVGVAKGGLFLAYLFDLFGLDTKIAEAHAHNTEPTFKWIDEVSPEDFHDKRIVVLERDVVTGNTARIVYEELKKYDPKKIDLVLHNNPGSILSELPEYLHSLYDDIHYPGKFSCLNIDKVLENLENRLNRLYSI
jgi:hypothetical protein